MRWLGRCPSCGAFNTLKEFREAPDVARAGRGAVWFASGAATSVAVPVSLREIDATRAKRLPVHPQEVARVLGGAAFALRSVTKADPLTALGSNR